MLLVDSTFFNVFSYDFVEGNPGNALTSPDKCVITESLAAVLFQDDMASMFRGKIILENDFTPGTVSVCVSFIVVTGLLAGIIPGLQISAFKPIDVVKGSFRFKSKMVFSRVFIMPRTSSRS